MIKLTSDATITDSRIVIDFEAAITNASSTVFSEIPMSRCFFNLGQSLYRRIPGDGLQAAYKNPEDNAIRKDTYMLLALALVPSHGVITAFELLYDNVPDSLIEVNGYTWINFFTGKCQSMFSRAHGIGQMTYNHQWVTGRYFDAEMENN